MDGELRDAILECLEQYFDNYDGEPLGGHIWTFIVEVCKQDGVASPQDYLAHIEKILGGE